MLFHHQTWNKQLGFTIPSFLCIVSKIKFLEILMEEFS